MISEWNFTKKIKKCLAKKEKEIKQSQVNQKQKTTKIQILKISTIAAKQTKILSRWYDK